MCDDYDNDNDNDCDRVYDNDDNEILKKTKLTHKQ